MIGILDETARAAPQAPLRTMPTGGEPLALKTFHAALIASGLAYQTAANYCSAVRLALQSLPSCKAEHVAAYIPARGFFYPRAWNLFADFARARGYDVDAIPVRKASRRGPAVQAVRRHPCALAITTIVRRAIRCGIDLSNGCALTLGDFQYAYESMKLRTPSGVMVKLPPSESACACALLTWAWDEVADGNHFGHGDANDPRLLVPTEPQGAEPMPTDWIIEIARGIGDARLIRMLTSLGF